MEKFFRIILELHKPLECYDETVSATIYQYSTLGTFLIPVLFVLIYYGIYSKLINRPKLIWWIFLVLACLSGGCIFNYVTLLNFQNVCLNLDIEDSAAVTNLTNPDIFIYTLYCTVASGILFFIYSILVQLLIKAFGFANNAKHVPIKQINKI